MRKIVLGWVLLFAACKRDGVGPPPTTGATSALISTNATTLTVGATSQLTATAFDAKMKAVAGVTFTWASENANVATVNAQGVVSGAAEGTTVIRATAGSVAGTVSITVNKDYCTNALSLAVGEVRVLSGPSAVSCLTLAATTGATDYLFVTANATPIPDDLGSYSVNLSQGSSPSIAAAYTLDAIDPRRALEREAVSYTDWMEERVRADERLAARRVFAGGNRPTLRVDKFLNQALVAAAVPAVGDQLTYHVPNINASKLCTAFTDVRAIVKAVGRQAVVVQDVAAPVGGFTTSDFNAIAQEFDDKIYEADTLWFGAPADRNLDGHITILYTPEVNRATPSGSTGFTAGFFWGGDLFKKSEYPTTDPCPGTNEQELFYLLTPDPTGSINNNVRTTVTVRQGTRGVIAHEFQHMINQSVRMFNPAVDSLETPWLNEAMSHFAEEAVGRTIRGFGDSQPLTFDDINPSVILSDDYNAFFRQNLARLRSWMVRPDTASPVSIKARNQLAPRGAGWLLVRYAADRFSNGNPRAFFRKLAVGPQINIANLSARSGTPFDDILSGFLVAAFADDDGIAGLSSRYTVPSWNLRDVMTRFNTGVHPLLVAPLPGQIVTQSLSGSGNYFRLTRATSSPQTKFQMTAASGTPVSFDGARIYVLRLQ
ncbi:MAG: Ig-like domain-containing protein [Gemmatimonadaceae bacterium]